MTPQFPVIELLDRLTIAKVKHRRMGNELEVEYYQCQANNLNLHKVKQQLQDLETIHDTIWELEKELKNGCEQQLSLEEIGRRAIKIRDWNNKRVAIKNQMATILDCPILEIKRDHLSE